MGYLKQIPSSVTGIVCQQLKKNESFNNKATFKVLLATNFIYIETLAGLLIQILSRTLPNILSLESRSHEPWQLMAGPCFSNYFIELMV